MEICGHRYPAARPARFVPDRLAAFGEVGQRGRRQAVGGEVVGQAECVELANGVRQQVDADTQRLDPIDALEDPDGKAGTVQAQCRGQTTDPTTGDDDVVHFVSRPSRRSFGLAAMIASRCSA